MEKWKSIKNFEGLYEVSSCGRVKSVSRKVLRGSSMMNVKERFLKPATDAKGYLRVGLARQRKLTTKKVHRLVSEAFIPNALNKPTVNHINGIKTDNRIENLEWNTYQENALHAVENGLFTYKTGCDHQRSKLTKEQISRLVEMKNNKVINRIIAAEFNVSVSCVKRTFKREAIN